MLVVYSLPVKNGFLNKKLGYYIDPDFFGTVKDEICMNANCVRVEYSIYNRVQIFISLIDIPEQKNITIC